MLATNKIIKKIIQQTFIPYDVTIIVDDDKVTEGL